MFLHNPNKTAIKRTVVSVRKPAGVSKSRSKSRSGSASASASHSQPHQSSHTHPLSHSSGPGSGTSSRSNLGSARSARSASRLSPAGAAVTATRSSHSPGSRSHPIGLAAQSSSETNALSVRGNTRVRKEIKRKPTIEKEHTPFSDSDSDSDSGSVSASDSDADRGRRDQAYDYAETASLAESNPLLTSPAAASASSSGRTPRKRTKSGHPQPDSLALQSEAARQDRRDLRPWSEADARKWPLIHAADLTAKSTRIRYSPLFGRTPDNCAEVVLQYPSALPRERFALVYPANDSESYSPVEDILHTIDIIVHHFLPSSESEKFSSPITGLVPRFRRAALHQSLDSIQSITSEFNRATLAAFRAATMPPLTRPSTPSSTSAGSPSRPTCSGLSAATPLPFPITDRILSQVYSRTVSPRVELLKQYENGTSDVYGELLPRFISQIFAHTGLTRDSVFVDFGSGVGNVVLQAALEIGCEAWGIEKNDNPARLGAAQLREFVARTRLWGITPGRARLVHGDFLTTPEIDSVLACADVILVNNKAFLPALNDRLLMKFLDVKEGARIVSLKSFLPKGWQIKPRNEEDLRNVLRVERREYFSGSVSWTDSGGEYFIATKDSTELREYVARSRRQ